MTLAATTVDITPPSHDTDAVRLADLHRTFDGHVVLDGISLRLRPGEFVALLGRSGSGKTTLLRAVSGLDTGATGTIDVVQRGAVVFQEHRLLPWKRVWPNSGQVPRP